MLARVFRQIFTNNLPAKIASLLLATLLWAVIKKSQLNDPAATMPSQPAQSVEFGAGAYGK
jgi:YbbR domain-containing protein